MFDDQAPWDKGQYVEPTVVSDFAPKVRVYFIRIGRKPVSIVEFGARRVGREVGIISETGDGSQV